MISNHLEMKYVDLNKIHITLQRELREFITMKSYHIFKKRNIRNKVENLIGQHYEIILDSYQCIELLETAKKEVRERLEFSPHFSDVTEKLITDDLEYTPLNFDLFNTCADFAKEKLEQTFNWRLAFYGAFFGALTAFLIQYGSDIISLLKTLVGFQ